MNVSLWYHCISALLKKSLPGAPVGVNITGVPAPICDAAPAVEAAKEADDDDDDHHLDLSGKKLKRKRKLQLNTKLRRKIV